MQLDEGAADTSASRQSARRNKRPGALAEQAEAAMARPSRPEGVGAATQGQPAPAQKTEDAGARRCHWTGVREAELALGDGTRG